MPDPLNPTAPAKPVAPPAGEPAGQEVTPEQVRETLGLPPESTDQEVITALIAIVANLQARYEASLDEGAQAEAVVANRDFEPFAALIPAERHEFWIGSLIRNREATMAALAPLTATSPLPLVAAAPAPEVVSPAAGAPIALVNRALRTPPAITAAGSCDAVLAAKIRNRAGELVAAGQSYRDAFDNAAREMTK